MRNLTYSNFCVLILLALIFTSIPVFAQPQDIQSISSEETFLLSEEKKLTHKTIKSFPIGDLFWPLIADPKQSQFFVSLRRYSTPDTNANAAAVGYGETFGVYRRADRENCCGFQINISGALLAQFNLDAPSKDLVNADYIIGFPLTYRKGDTSMRFRIYHQSSHLGDEFLMHNNLQRINLSFESFEYLLSRQWRGCRVYGGGEYLFHREPAELKPQGLHGGLEYYRSACAAFSFPLVAGLDVKSWEENEWSVDTSFMIGTEIGAIGPGRRRLRFMAEWYKGHAPHGQFYRDWISYYGLGIYLGF
ncbi:MAG: DUF1207 domain-containing protein [bacterium]